MFDQMRRFAVRLAGVGRDEGGSMLIESAVSISVFLAM